MRGLQRIAPNELANLGYKDLSHISETDEFRIYRARARDGKRVRIKIPISETPSATHIHQLEHEFEISSGLNPEKVVRPNKIERGGAVTALIFEDCEYPPLSEWLRGPMQIEPFLTFALGIVSALAEIHCQGLVHKDITPDNIFITADGNTKLGGFGVATRLLRERQAPVEPYQIAGTCVYMSPEQTGRMNRSVDTRSDLYSLGLIFYQMLTGKLPFKATDAMGWVYCHLAFQPKSPRQQLPSVPAQLSDMVIRLLAKEAEQRYQTADGLQKDLRHCLEQWLEHGAIEPFELGQWDSPSHLMIPERLYGRASEVQVLLTTVNRVASSGKAEVLLVSGYSGVGKSTLINEMHRALVSPEALFAEGKYDQYKRDTPYDIFAQTLQSLVHQILGKPENEIAQWREDLNQALQPNGRLITDLVPDLVSLIGEQPAVAEVPRQDAQNRFNHVMRSLIEVFARPQHPLVLFLDDLQWLDTASLQLLQHLLGHSSLKHLLVLGAYRINEVGSSHPLTQTIETIRNSDTRLSEIALHPLQIGDLCQLIADTLRTDTQRVLPLAKLVQEKTNGNPFFVTQFLASLADENLLVFEPHARAWNWDLDAIHAKGYSDSAVDLMIGKLDGLPNTTKQALTLFAYLGSAAEAGVLATLCGRSKEALTADLSEAVQAGLISCRADTYHFLHDRIEEAAYQLIPDTERKALHLKIGRLLLDQFSPELLKERVFDVVDQLNRSIDMVTDNEERETLRRLNTAAGRKARGAAAYASARRYLENAMALLPADAWNECHAECLTLFLELAECEYLVSDFKRADELLASALVKTRTRIDISRVHRLRLQLYQVLGRFNDALEVAFEALELFGVLLPGVDEDSAEATEVEHQIIAEKLHGRQIHDLLNAPLAKDVETHAVIGLITDSDALFYLMRPELYSLLIAKAVNICMQQGHVDESAYIYNSYAMAVAADIRNIDTAEQFSELGVELSKRNPGAAPVRGKVLFQHAVTIMIWRHHFADCLPVLEQAFHACIDSGDLVYGAYTIKHAPWLYMESGEPLDRLVEKSYRYIAFAKENHNDTLYHIDRLQQQFALALQGETRSLTDFCDATFDEKQTVAAIEQAGMQMGIAFYAIYKQIVTFIAGQYEEALDWAGRAAPLLVYVSGCAHEPTHYFFHALTLAALHGKVPVDQQRVFEQRVGQILDKIQLWADACPENFSNRYLLLSAEFARLKKDDLEAMKRYDDAIASARNHAFIHNEALANELAASFYRQRGFEKIARSYLTDAFACYTHWGATGKTRQLKRLHPWLAQGKISETASLAAHLDAVSLAKAQRAISGEIQMESLAQTLLRIVMESAGAQVGFLSVEGISRLRAEMQPGSGNSQQILFDTSPGDEDIPGAVVNYVRHSRETVILDDAGSHTGAFSGDEYLRRVRPKSVLCLAIQRQEKLLGVLYLENDLVAGAFTPERRSVLEALSGQAAISLENAHLYDNLKESESRFRTLVQKVQAAVVVHGSDTQILTANPMAQQLLGLTEEQLLGQTAISLAWHFLREDGSVMPVREYPVNQVLSNKSPLQNTVIGIDRPDQEDPVWALVSAMPLFDEKGAVEQIVVSFSDISERRKAEQQLAASEQLFRTMVENSPNHIARYDLKLRRIYINPSLEKEFTVPLKKVLGKTSKSASPLIDPERYMANMRRVIESGQEQSDEIAYRSREGEIRWASSRFAPEFDVEGKVQSVLVISNDTTDRRLAEQELASTKQMYQTLVENLPDCIARFDTNGRHLFVNASVEKTFGVSREILLKKSLTESGKPGGDEQNALLQESIQRVFESGQAEQLEALWETMEGPRDYEIQHLPELDEQGNVISVLGIAHDVTQAKQALERDREHLVFLEALDRINQVLHANGNFESILKCTLDEVLDIFDCDRAYLQYPCEPDAPDEWRIPIERCKPEYPSPLPPDRHLPYHPHIAETLRAMRDSDSSVLLGPGTDYPIPPEIREQLGVRSLMAISLHPKVDRPWHFAIHQCSHDRTWSDNEIRLFEEIGHRISDSLNSLLITRNLRESEERFRLVYENSPVPIWEEDFSAVKARLDELQEQCSGDLETYLEAHPEVVAECAGLVRIVNVNGAALELQEADSKQALYEGLPKTFIPESYAAFRQELTAIARGDTELYFDGAVKTFKGKRREVSVSFAVCPGYEHSLSKVFVSLFDITQRKRDEENLRLAASVFSTSQEGILISNADNRIIDVNPAFTRLTGYSRDEALGKDPGFLNAGQHDQRFFKQMWQTIGDTGEWQGEIWNRRKSGEIYPELLSIVAVNDDQDRLQHYVGVFSDITMIKQHEADLDRIAHYDTLTSVPNRRLLGDRLEQAIAYSRRHGKNLAVCYLDLDGFKPINDQFGHESGDRMLVEIASRLQSMSRSEDTVARLGGDEFVLLWNNIGNEEDCARALERILNKVSQPMFIEKEAVSVSASIGVTLYPDDPVDADSLLRHADHAMYMAKQLGKNRYQIFDARLERQISVRSEQYAMVERGLEKGEFELYYQPKVDFTQRKVVGVEALLRWNDPVLGLILPNEFLSLIENDRLAIRVGRIVMEEAVRQAKRWDDQGIKVPVSINIFPRHLKSISFIDDLSGAIASQWPQIPTRRLLMEIIETSALEELEPIEGVINKCLKLGVGFSLDDFGTGYSSLVYLRRLSIEELKIDQSFVRDMLDDPDDEAIVIGVISLGKAFGLQVVAEGVENTRQAEHLVGLGCNIVQGYGLGCPMPADTFQKWYADFLTNDFRQWKD